MLNISGITLSFNQPSEINGAPIGTLLQVGSNNQKIGYSLQTVHLSNLRMLSRQVQMSLYVVTVSAGLLLAVGVT